MEAPRPTSSIDIIFGANKDKDLKTMLTLIGSALHAQAAGRANVAGGAASPGPRVRAVHLVSSSHPKACPPTELLAYARAAAPEAPWRTEHATMAAALAAAASDAAADELECTVVFGSVFVVADARAQLASLRPDMFHPSDWAFEQAGEPSLY
jgi:folylpolyglutamate synthase/dihydropteroate synthase